MLLRWHVALEVAPIIDDDVPAGHIVGILIPTAEQYVFGGHGVHGELPVDEYVPGAHFTCEFVGGGIMSLRMHVALEVAPTIDDVVPAGHIVGIVVPRAEQYVFGGHGVHGELPVDEYVPGAHFTCEVVGGGGMSGCGGRGGGMSGCGGPGTIELVITSSRSIL